MYRNAQLYSKLKMKASVILSLILLASAARMRIPTDERLAQIDSTSYGKGLLDTIELEMTSGASTDKIVEMLDALAADLTADQKADDADWAQKNQECIDQKAEFNAQIDAAEAEILDATNLLAQYRPELATTEEQLATKGTEIADLSAELNAFIGAHGEDSFDYEARMAEHKAVIAAIDEAIAEMNGLVGSVAGEGIHDNSERISAETAVGAFAQIKALSKLASKADQGAVAKIVALLEDIKGNLEASVADENQGQVMAEEDYNALKSAMEATLADLTLAQTNLTNKKADLEGKIATQETRLAENEEALRVATEALAAKTRQCDEWETKYNNDKAKRIEELDIVQQCRAIFTDESMQFSKFLSDRVEY